ncbi:MAG: CBS domain-containing protein [Pirellulaceae bacterium]
MNLSEMFRSEVVTATPEEPVRTVVERMRDQHVGAVVVVDKQKVVGIVTDRDVAMKFALGDATPTAPIRELMTTDVKTIWDDQGIFNATQYMLGHKVRRLPIIDRHDTLIGMVTADDLLVLLARELANVAKAVEPMLNVKAF